MAEQRQPGPPEGNPDVPAVSPGQGVLLPALVPDPPPAPVLVPLGRWDWERVIRVLPLAPELKLTALMAATWAGKDGRSIHPGERLLAEAVGKDPRSVRRHLAKLVSLGLLERVSRGGGRHGTASEYRLVAPEGTPVTGDRS